jgi:NAD+ kinase
MPSDCDVVIVVGGDGSFIDASQFAIRNDIPIIGINLGKTGFLSEVEPTELNNLARICENNFKVEEKMLLSVNIINADGEVLHSDRLAVNDIVISHTSYMGVAEFLVYTKEGGVKYRADGVVVSTPAGSTAYSLSAGGPVVSHSTEAVIVTPIAPHSLFNRSIIFDSRYEIRIKNMGAEELNLSVDGRFVSPIPTSAKCSITVSDKKLKVLTFKENNMFANLFNKIQVVEDVI